MRRPLHLGAGEVLFLAAVFVLCVPAQAHAYVDPSVMTYTIQALAGVAVALSAVLGVAWRRVRRHLLGFLHIDENANKQVDGAIHELDPGSSDYDELTGKADAAARRMKEELEHEKPEQLLWGTRFFFSLAASIMLAFTIMVASPLELVASSGTSLFFTVPDVWVPLVIWAVIASLALALVLSAVRGKAFGICLAVVVALGIASYVQSMFLNSQLPAADGLHVRWIDYLPIMISSTVIWVALVAAAVVLSLRKSLFFKGFAVGACLVCVIAQAIALTVLLETPGSGDLRPIDPKPVVTMDGMFDVSDKDNVIFIVLDTYDVKYLKAALEEDPHALDEFTGFTCFMNTTGSMIPTRYAMASLMTGRNLTDEDASFGVDLMRRWYIENNIIDDIRAQDYRTDVYASDIYDAIVPFSEKAENIHMVDRRIDPMRAAGVLLKCSLYRNMPWLLKPFFWFYTDEVNNAVLVNGEDLDVAAWNLDDAGYHRRMRKEGLHKKHEKPKGHKGSEGLEGLEGPGEYRGSFRVLHFTGAHYPYVMDRHGEHVDTETTLLEQSLGSLHVVDEYLRQLKELGVYDSATIVVTADHGEYYLAEDINRPTNPIILVKPAENAERACEPVVFSDAPIDHSDLAKTVLDAVGADSSSYEGMNVFDVTDGDRVRYYNATSVVGEDHVYTAIKQWKIVGDALDWDNWEKTGKEWPIE